MIQSLRFCPILAAAALVSLIACSEHEGAEPNQADGGTSELSFVGGETCGSCHAAEMKNWRGSHHDLAMQPADENTVLGDFDDAAFDHYGVRSTFFKRDGKFFARTDGPESELRDFEIAYTFGFDPLQQYLIEFPGGRLQALSVVWDARPEAEGGQRWFHLYPDGPIPAGDVLHWTGPNQNWNFMCAGCHSTGLQKNYDAREDVYETHWAEIDVSCEACHGPGSAHLSWAKNGASADVDNGLGVDLRNDGEWRFEAGRAIARRSPEKGTDAQLDTCGRCHARRASVNPEPARGQSLLDTHRPALLDPGLYHADGQIRDEVYVWGSFLQSRMHAAGVVCSDCHEPHSLALPESPDQTCLGCHRAEKFAVEDHHRHSPESAGSSCVACHMPSRIYMGVDSRRDHSFRVPRPDLTVEIGTPNACTDCHAEQSADWAAESIENWFGTERMETPHYARTLHAGRARAPGAARALAELALESSTPGIVRATAFRLLPPDAQAEDTVRRGLGDADPLVRMAALEATEGLDPRLRMSLARQLLRDPVRGVRIQAAHAAITVPTQLWEPDDRVLLRAPLAEYRAAQHANADRPEAHVNLAVLAAAVGELELARKEYEIALRLGPWFVPAYVNYADLYRRVRSDDAAERVLRRGIEQIGNSAELAHALGLTLVRQGQAPQAIAELERAATWAPEVPRYAYVYGIALQSAGEGEQALQVLNAAHLLHPGDRDLLTALATMSRDAGDLEAAHAYAVALVELIPQDPGARQLLSEVQAKRAATE